MGSIPVRVIKKLLNPKIEELFLVFGSQSSGMSTVVAALCLTRTGIRAKIPLLLQKNYGPARMHFSVPAGPCFCFSVLVEIRQKIFRLCGQSIGTGGGQLCFAPEAPESA